MVYLGYISSSKCQVVGSNCNLACLTYHPSSSLIVNGKVLHYVKKSLKVQSQSWVSLLMFWGHFEVRNLTVFMEVDTCTF